MFRFDLYHRKNFSIRLILCILILCGIGLVVLNSAMSNDVDHDSTMMKQMFGIVVGFILMMVLTFIDYHYILRFAPVIYLLNLLLLVLVLTPLGVNVNGATRWLKIGIQIQPSEFSKIFMLIFLSWFFWKNEHRINRPTIIFGSLFLFAVPAVLILQEPDLSTTLVLLFVFLALIYTAKISYRWILRAILVAIPLIGLGYFLLMRYQEWFYTNIYQARRILSWMYPDVYVSTGNNTQQENSVLAIASGQLFGKGINNTSFESVKNGNFLSEENTDFIFAVIGEELGFVGSVFIIGIFTIMVILLLRIASKASDLSGRLICTGMAALIAFQAFVNISVATQLLPNTGLPLPFISAGVSSLFSMFGGMGLVMNVALQRPIESKW